MPKNVQLTTQLHSFHLLAWSCLKSFKLGFNSTWTKKLQMYKLDLERQGNQKSNCQHLLDHRESKKIPEKKHLTSASLMMLKPLTVWITINCGKFLKRWEYPSTLCASCKTYIQVKKHKLKPDVEQWTGSELGKKYVKPVYCHPAYLTNMQSTSCKLLGWKHKFGSR